MDESEELTTGEVRMNELKEQEEVKATLEPLPPGLRGEKYEAYIILRTAGMPQTRAAKVLGLSKAWSSKIGRTLDKRYDLTNSKFVKLASKAIENILKGQTFGEVESIKGANVVAAAQMVYDRAQPATKQVDIHSQVINLTDEELDIKITALLQGREDSVPPVEIEAPQEKIPLKREGHIEKMS